MKKNIYFAVALVLCMVNTAAVQKNRYWKSDAVLLLPVVAIGYAGWSFWNKRKNYENDKENRINDTLQALSAHCKAQKEEHYKLLAQINYQDQQPANILLRKTQLEQDIKSAQNWDQLLPSIAALKNRQGSVKYFDSESVSSLEEQAEFRTSEVAISDAKKIVNACKEGCGSITLYIQRISRIYKRVCQSYDVQLGSKYYRDLSIILGAMTMIVVKSTVQTRFEKGIDKLSTLCSQIEVAPVGSDKQRLEETRLAVKSQTQEYIRDVGIMGKEKIVTCDLLGLSTEFTRWYGSFLITSHKKINVVTPASTPTQLRCVSNALKEWQNKWALEPGVDKNYGFHKIVDIEGSMHLIADFLTCPIDWNARLLQAIRSNNLLEVDTALNNGANANTKDHNSRNALWHAIACCARGECGAQIIERLMSSSSDPDDLVNASGLVDNV